MQKESGCNTGGATVTGEREGSGGGTGEREVIPSNFSAAVAAMTTSRNTSYSVPL